jgi:hypothetical protein
MSENVQLDSDHAMMMAAIAQERKRQLEKWGVQRHPDGTGSSMASLIADQWKRVCDTKHGNGEDDWATIAAEEFFESLAETDKRKLFDEVVQMAAVFTAWGEDLIKQVREENDK